MLEGLKTEAKGGPKQTFHRMKLLLCLLRK